MSSLCFEGCARVIDETGSDVKLIAVLRDPVSRLISAHTFCSQWPELEPLGLEAAIKDEPRRIRDSECRICWHVDLGFYARQLAPYVQRFGDRLKIVLFDDLRQDTQGTVADVCRFLGIDDEVDLDVGGTYNRGGRLVHPRLHRLVRRDSGVRRIVQAVMPLGLRRRIRSRLDEFVRTSVVLDKAIRNELRARFLQDIGRLEVMIARDLSAWKKKIEMRSLQGIAHSLRRCIQYFQWLRPASAARIQLHHRPGHRRRPISEAADAYTCGVGKTQNYLSPLPERPMQRSRAFDRACPPSA